MRNLATTGFWVLIAHLLLTFSPAAGPGINKAYGAFPLAGTVHVNATASLPPDGLSCDTGWRTIREGINDAASKGAGVVMVCDTSTYSENVTMRDGISLVSMVGSGLPATVTGTDVLNLCMGSTQGSDLPTITTSFSGPVVTFSGLKKPASLVGFHVTGGVTIRGDGGGILVDKCKSVSIVTNCIDNNSAVDGGGVAITGSGTVTIDRNAIHDNSSTLDGGGVFSTSNKLVTYTGNLFQNDKAGRSGGGLHSSDSDETHAKDHFKSDTATDGFGGGANHEDSKKVTYTDCIFLQNTSIVQGGAGLNLYLVKSAKVSGCQFQLCSAGFGNLFMSPQQLFSVQPGGGGLRVEGSDTDVSNSSFIDCSTVLDGGGLLILSKSTFPNVLKIDTTATCSVANCTFTGNQANDDGGGVSNQVGTFLSFTDSTLENNSTVSTGQGGGFHSTGKAVTIANNLTFKGNASANDAGAIYIRSAKLVLSNSGISSNTAANDAGGLQLFCQSEVFLPIHVPYPVIDVESILRCTNVTWQGNQAAHKGGALHVKRFAGQPKSASFHIDSNTFSGNQGATSSEAALRISLSDQPPPSTGRNRIKGCSFKNRGVQIEGDESVSFVSNFYDIEDCLLDLTTPFQVGVEPFPIGIRLFQDSPTIKGTATLFQGPDGTSPFGISAVKSAPDVLDARFSKVGTGISAGDSTITVKRCTFEDSFFGVFYTHTNGSIQGSTFQRDHTGIVLVNGCVVNIVPNNTFANNGTNIDTTGN